MKKIKVAIIGAGPSGFSVAEVLRNKNYEDSFEVTIYEGNDRVGGKCCTVFADGEICNGQTGGYDVGAAILTPGDGELRTILSKANVTLSPFTETARPRSAFVSKGKPVTVHPIFLKQFLKHPLSITRALGEVSAYAKDYVRYSRSRHAGYTNRPSALNVTLSTKYPKRVNRRLAYLMQGFGYADLDDNGLTPPLLYYHQYYDAGFLNAQMVKVAEGTQGIWAKLAETYPTDSIRLNEPVESVSRDSDKVMVKTPQGLEEYDYIVVGTPIKSALAYLDLTQEQRIFLRQVKHNHYATVLCETAGLNANTTFNLDACEDKKQVGRVMCAYKRYPDSDIASLYLFLPDESNASDTDIVGMAAKSLKEDFSVNMTNEASAKVFHWTDYFGHLDTESLNNGWYDQFEKMFQGKNRTLFVSSGLHMETVGASIQFGTREAKKYAKLWLQQQTKQ